MDIDEIDEDYSLLMIEHNKYDYCKVKCQFKLVFDGEKHTEYITARSFDKRTEIWWKDILNDVISGFRIIGHKFDYVGELNIITIVN